MGIVLARVDNRFIHGQVLEGWLPYARATSIVVASDEVAKNPIQKAAMEASMPSNLGLRIMGVLDAVKGFLNGEFEGGRVIIIFGNTGDALRAVNSGLKIEELNIGNIHFCPGKLQISPAVSVDTADLDNLEALADTGVRVVIRCVPSDQSRSIWDVVKRDRDA